MMTQHPLPVGARVRHYGRQWTDKAFATIVQVEPSGKDYEYLVQVDEDSGWITAGEQTWWPSYYTRLGDEQ